jgi:DNA-binding transcriptional MocR family regulator
METFLQPDAARPHWMPVLVHDGAPLYLQIAGALESAVADGALRPGDRLPPQRVLAGALGVDLTTITRAYDEARRRKLLDAVTGRGSFVASRGTHPDETIDLGMNIPPAPRGMSLAELIGRDVAALLRGTDADRLMTYHVGPGTAVDRAAGALWLEPLLGTLPAGRIVVAPGAQAALAAVLSLRAKAGDTILAERLTYPGLIAAAAQLGLNVVGIATDGEGPLPQALEAACRAHAPRLVYLLPTMQNPTTVTTPEPRRREIVRIAARMRLPILEDDPYALLAGNAPPAFATLLPQQTTYIATVSKTLTPGLRQAYVVLPAGEGGEALVGALRALDLMPAPLMTALLTRWIREGTATRILEAVRSEAALRQRLATELLPSAAGHRNGLHVWQPLPPRWNRHRLIEAARRHGLGVTPSDAFAVEAPAPDAVRISLGAVPDRTRLRDALATLAAIIREDRPGSYRVV